MNSVDWIAALGRLGPDDLRRISRLVDLLVAAQPARADVARRMLAAAPEPWTHDEARARCDAIARFLEQRPDDGAELPGLDSPITTHNGDPHGYC